MNDEATFYDSNILVYAFDESEPLKKKKCEKLVLAVFNGRAKGIVSNQVLAEVFFILTQKVRKPISGEKAVRVVFGFLKSTNWIKINYSFETVAKAAKQTSKHKTHFWDTLIAETMLENQVCKIFTENEKDFSKIKQIKAVSPL